MPPRPRLSDRSILAIATGAAKPTRAKPRHLEAEQQRLYVRRWRLDPRTRNLPACAVPNGGKRSAREAALMKAEGVAAGVPDWLCFVPSGGFVGLALEFKSPDNRGRVTDAQREWHERLMQCGWRVEIVTSAEQAWTIAMSYFNDRNP